MPQNQIYANQPLQNQGWNSPSIQNQVWNNQNQVIPDQNAGIIKNNKSI